MNAKKSQHLLLTALCASSLAIAAPKLQVKTSQLAGEWACQIKAQRDPIHTFAPSYIAFSEEKDLPAHLYVAYFEHTLQENKQSAPLRYREYYWGFWNIKDGNRVLLTLSSDGAERLYKPEDIKDPQLRQKEQRMMDFLEEMANKKGFKSTNMRVLAISNSEMTITDDESLLHCRKEKSKQ